MSVDYLTGNTFTKTFAKKSTLSSTELNGRITHMWKFCNQTERGSLSLFLKNTEGNLVEHGNKFLVLSSGRFGRRMYSDYYFLLIAVESAPCFFFFFFLCVQSLTQILGKKVNSLYLMLHFWVSLHCLHVLYINTVRSLHSFQTRITMRLTLLAHGPYNNTYSVNKLRCHIMEKNELASVPVTKNCEGDFTYFSSWLERKNGNVLIRYSVTGIFCIQKPFP